MGNTEYFDKIGYKPKYIIGDRVTGVYKGIRWVGSVGNDTLVSLEEGPRVSIHLDLPFKLENIIYNILIVKHKDIKKLSVL
jgi:hypothetical protein